MILVLRHALGIGSALETKTIACLLVVLSKTLLVAERKGALNVFLFVSPLPPQGHLMVHFLYSEMASIGPLARMLFCSVKWVGEGKDCLQTSFSRAAK